MSDVHTDPDTVGNDADTYVASPNTHAFDADNVPPDDTPDTSDMSTDTVAVLLSSASTGRHITTCVALPSLSPSTYTYACSSSRSTCWKWLPPNVLTNTSNAYSDFLFLNPAADELVKPLRANNALLASHVCVVITVFP
jgi:hypothetical protein